MSDEFPESINPAGDDRTNTSKPTIASEIFCHQCGYNLRGLTETRCPECGKESPALANADPQIPWIHREEIGTFRAFRKTVWFATFSPRKLSEDVYLHIDFREAKKFRWWTIGVAMFWMVGLTFLLHVAGRDGQFVDSDINAILGMYWPSVVGSILTLIYLILATGIPSLFFDYRDLPINLRNNAIALSYYCTAPLTWWPIPMLIAIRVIREDPTTIKNMWIAIPLVTATVIAPFAPIILWCFLLYRIAKRVLRDQTNRRVWLSIGVPMLWLLAGIVVFGLIPIAGFYVWVLIDALS